MPIDPDPRSHVASTVDFYSLLSVPNDFTPEILRRAYRQTSKRYHPDKVLKPDSSDHEKELAREKWDLFEVAKKLLEDPDLRSQYDSARAAREHKRKRDAAQDSIRKQMIDRLEARENAAKRNSDQVIGDEGEDEREARRLAADGARRREAFMAKRRARTADHDQMSGSSTPAVTSHRGSPSMSTPAPRMDDNALPEERTVKVRYPAERESDFDPEKLEVVFEQFGLVDAVMMAPAKKERIEAGARKQLLGRSYVQFIKKEGAAKAVSSWRRAREESPGPWHNILDVTWLAKSMVSSSDPSGASQAQDEKQDVDVRGKRSSIENSSHRDQNSQSGLSLPSVRWEGATAAQGSFGSYQDYVMAKLSEAAKIQHGKETSSLEDIQMSTEPENSEEGISRPIPSFPSFRSTGLSAAQTNASSYKDAVLAKMKRAARREAMY